MDLRQRIKELLSRLKHSNTHKTVRVEGPLERIGDHWLLRIPLAVGGAQLAFSARGINEIKGDILEVSVPENMIRDLGLKEGQHLLVHNQDGKFTFEWAPASLDNPN